MNEIARATRSLFHQSRDVDPQYYVESLAAA